MRKILGRCKYAEEQFQNKYFGCDKIDLYIKLKKFFQLNKRLKFTIENKFQSLNFSRGNHFITSMQLFFKGKLT